MEEERDRMQAVAIERARSVFEGGADAFRKQMVAVAREVGSCDH